LYEKSGELALHEVSRRKPCPKNRVEEHLEKAVIKISLEKPAFGQVRVANELTKRHGRYRDKPVLHRTWQAGRRPQRKLLPAACGMVRLTVRLTSVTGINADSIALNDRLRAQYLLGGQASTSRQLFRL
jgi:hypothetical protein